MLTPSNVFQLLSIITSCLFFIILMEIREILVDSPVVLSDSFKIKLYSKSEESINNKGSGLLNYQVNIDDCFLVF